MIRSKPILACVTMICIFSGTPRELLAQRLYIGSTPSELQYSGNGGIDINGRAVNVDGQTFDRYGTYVDSYSWPSPGYRLPAHTSASYAARSPYGTAYPPHLGGFSGGGNAWNGGTSSRGAVIVPPRSIVVGGVYPSRTVMNNATRGTVIEYTHNGNGYISTPGSTYQTVISSGPSIFPYTTVVSPSQPPVIIESRPNYQPSAKAPNGNSGRRSVSDNRFNSLGEIKLIFPQESKDSFSYLLNGTVYTIKPGYVQTFSADRVWAIEFLRTGNGSQPMRYELTAGTYRFVADEQGWDLKKDRPMSPSELPPSPTAPELPALTPAPTPLPDL